METQPDRDRIAAEAVGQKHESPPSYAAKREDVSREEAARQLAASSGAQASTPDRTAESLGERVADAYSDPESVARHSPNKVSRQITPRDGSENTQRSGRLIPAPTDIGGFATVIASFALGYFAAVLCHGRITAQFGATQGPFQITKPPSPHGDKHPRGFVQSTVLKTITEHPQGMTITEITAELGPQGIGRQSIVDALHALVQADKVSLRPEGSKYLSAAAEVSTAPDQPSS
jgi:hypothetical protein